MVDYINIKLSSVSVDEIITSLEQSAKRWKRGMKNPSFPFCEVVIAEIEEQARSQGVSGDKFGKKEE